MDKKEGERPPMRENIRLWNIAGVYALPISVVFLYLALLACGLFLKAPEVITLAALAALPLLLSTTNLSAAICFLLVFSLFLLSLVLSGIENWRIVVAVATYLLPTLLLLFYRGVPIQAAKALSQFCEESEKMDSRRDICALAARLLRGSGFFRNVAILLWNRQTDGFEIAAGTSVYDVGTEIAPSTTHYEKCFVQGKVARFDDSESSIYFLPSRMHARSALCAPLMLGGKRYGAIVTESPHMRPWSRACKQILQFFSMTLSYSLAELERRDRVRIPAKSGAWPASKPK